VSVIPFIPNVPEGIAEAAQRGTLIPFVGAGASRLAGCPGWGEFADGALRNLVKEGKFSHAQLAQIAHLNPRVKLSIALGLHKEHGLPIKFQTLLHPKGKNDARGQRLFSSLSNLGRTFVTTNYDEWLDEAIVLPDLSAKTVPASMGSPRFEPRTIIYKVEDFTPANLNKPDTVIHLHGSLRAPDSMVLTTQHYVQHYANDRRTKETEDENRVLTFLEYLFTEKTVLFVGYGLEELEILEYVIVKARHLAAAAGPQTRHYLLQGFFSHEFELAQGLKRYYTDCGIELVPFLRDLNDWDQLIDVLEDFARKAPASTLMNLQLMREMEDLINE
jgi:hypothetical protein